MLERWRRQERAVAAEIRDRGFDSRLGAYVRRYGSGDLDASLLLLSVVGFESGAASRVKGTLSAIRRELGAGGPLVYRNVDRRGGPGGEGAFVACSFWLAQALVQAGERDEAGQVVEETWRLANDVGLFAEEIHPSSGEHRGNFPQGLSHAALVKAALDVES